ncbi:unnamed protein product [Phaeothamnion confervicola]
MCVHWQLQVNPGFSRIREHNLLAAMGKSVPFYDQEALLEKHKEAQALRSALAREERSLLHQLSALEKENADLSAALRLGSIATQPFASSNSSGSSDGGSSASASGRAMELRILNREILGRQPELESEIVQWEKKVSLGKEALKKAEKKLEAVPKRFVQSLESVYTDGRALQQEIARLREGAAKVERRAANSLRVEADEAETAREELEDVLQRLAEAEAERNMWAARVRAETAKLDAIRAHRGSIQASLSAEHGERAFVKAAFLLGARGGSSIPTERVADSVRPFLAAEVDVDDTAIMQALRASGIAGAAATADVADHDGGGTSGVEPLSFEQFDTVVRALEGLALDGERAAYK